MQRAVRTSACCRVLRLREGARLEVCDGNGGLVLAELRGIAHNNKAYVETIEDIRQVHLPRQQPSCQCVSLLLLGNALLQKEAPLKAL